jgi:hypothetical protein
MKLLCLIIDSDPQATWRETYDHHRGVWNTCLDLHRWVEGYFLRADPTLPSEYSVEGRLFTSRGRESYETILDKTQKAIETLLAGHDYVVRTNISSLYDFALIASKDLPKQDLYAGFIGHSDYGPYVGGSGMILSRDVAQKLLAPPAELRLSAVDDIAIAQILAARGVFPRHEARFDYDYGRGLEQVLAGHHIHYRLRDCGDEERRREREVTDHVFAEIRRAAASYARTENA